MTTTHDRSAATSVPPISAIQHIGLTVTDVERSEAWYGRVLGMHRIFTEPHHGGNGQGYAVVLGAPALGLNIGLDHHPDGHGRRFDPCVTGLDHVCFSVASRTELDNWTAHLERCGVLHSGVTEFEMGGMHFAVLNFRDPDDIALELMAVS